MLTRMLAIWVLSRASVAIGINPSNPSRPSRNGCEHLLEALKGRAGLISTQQLDLAWPASEEAAHAAHVGPLRICILVPLAAIFLDL